MGRNVQLSELREDVRQRCDLPTFTSSTFITTDAVTRMINVSLQTLYSRLMEAWGEGYFSKSGNITANIDNATSDLPADFLKMVSAHWLRGTDDIVPMREASIDDLRFAQFASREWSSPRYRLRTNTILWVPTPSVEYEVAVEYVYAAPDLSADDDTFDAGPGWDEYVVLDVCRKVFERQEKDAQHFIAARNEVERNIITLSPHRSETENHVVRESPDDRMWGTRDLRDMLWRDG